LTLQDIQTALRDYWGYDSFLPLQREAMTAAVSGRDSLVVLPTGGGKSLCYQAPAVTLPGLSIVVSPLISLMKDQVDALTECGVPAARFDSSVPYDERDHIVEDIYAGRLKLLYVSPERLMMGGFLDMLSNMDISMVAVDEAHCVSTWGHDFRPEYRQLGLLKEALHGLPIHAYTATATQHVRDDIAVQLKLDDPEVLVGSFDRPNLVYKVLARTSKLAQVRSILDRHTHESGIVYCIRRRDVDELSHELTVHGYKARPYHAGMSPRDRKQNQDAFMKERVDTIVATVAFGMGIDKSNVRYVIHTGLPKSLEHYQQESGRAGRDGLQAECCLLYSGGDYGVWKSILSNEPNSAKIAERKLNDMYAYATGATCRHHALVSYFGQALDSPNCSACDICLGDVECVEDALVTAQKILSCVARLRRGFGGEYIAQVLTGSQDKRILQNGHDSLSTHGLLAEHSKRIVRDWLEQLLGQGYMRREGEFNVVKLTERGAGVLKGEETPRLIKPVPKKAKKRKAPRGDVEEWVGVDHDLFEHLRERRSELAAEQNVPAYVVFGDRSLRDMARRLPGTTAEMLACHGVGEKKLAKYGKVFLAAIEEFDRSPVDD
jgi:ATP-dependent DNA helicase RecQ